MYEEKQNLGLDRAIDLRLARILTGIPDTEQALVLRGPAVMDDAYLTAEPSPDWVDWAALDHVVGDVDADTSPAERRDWTRTSTSNTHSRCTWAGGTHRARQPSGDWLRGRLSCGHRLTGQTLIRRTLTSFIAAYAAEAAQAGPRTAEAWSTP